jgi:hypothetical protein
MAGTTPSAEGVVGAVRCFTRALKNARHLQAADPQRFATDPGAQGFGTGIPIELLSSLHRLQADSPVLSRHPMVADFLRQNPLPLPDTTARGPLFSGTVYFAQITFQTPSRNLVIPDVDMNMIVEYARRAAVPISEYAAQYGGNSVSISPDVIAFSVNLPNASFTDGDLRAWVNTASQNQPAPESSIFVVVPPGITASGVGGNAGYHGLADIPYMVAGVFAQNLTLQDVPDVYAMVVSHELAEMVVDPSANGQNPEVCDPCDVNCTNLTRFYFDDSDDFLGVNQASPPGGFAFSYYICSVVKPEGASNCPAPAVDCQYQPPTDIHHLSQLDAAFIGNDGGLWVAWVYGAENWASPVAMGQRGLAPPGAPVALAKQLGLED